MAYVSEKVPNSSEAGLEPKPIDWNDFNYPICLKIFHYTPSEIPQAINKKIILLRVNHILILIACILNFITNIVNAGQGVDGAGIRIAISAFLFLGWLPASFYIFIIPYEIMMRKQQSPLIFYVLSIIAICWFFIWAIADFADANGFVMVAKNATNNRNAAALFGAITSILMLAVSIIAAINLVVFWRRNRATQD